MAGEQVESTGPAPEPKAPATPQREETTPQSRGPGKPIPETTGDIDLSGIDGGGSWPEDWRDRLADGDDKARKMLDRFTDPGQLWKKIINQERVIRSRKDGTDRPGPDASQEEIAEWRRRSGIPVEPTEYLDNLELEPGKVIGDDDLPLVEVFAEAMHEVNAPQEIVNKAISTYLSLAEDIEANQVIEDDQFKVASRDRLREEWGPADMKRNLNIIAQAFEGYEELWERLFAGRTNDGKVIGNDPDVLQFIADLGLRALGPEASVMQGGLPANAQGIETEIAELKRMSGQQDSEYWRGENATKHQARLAELLQVQEKMSARRGG